MDWHSWGSRAAWLLDAASVPWQINIDSYVSSRPQGPQQFNFITERQLP